MTNTEAREGPVNREALAAALLAEDQFMSYLIDKGWNLGNGNLRSVWTAARERLAQLPEKCKHGPDSPHTWTTVLGERLSCSGKVYPAELVERIARVLYRRYPLEPVSMNRDVAVAVLDALNGEMP